MKNIQICFSALAVLISLGGMIKCLKIRISRIKVLPGVLFFMITGAAFLYWGITMIFGG